MIPLIAEAGIAVPIHGLQVEITFALTLSADMPQEIAEKAEKLPVIRAQRATCLLLLMKTKADPSFAKTRASLGGQNPVVSAAC
jgi:hypothetical protein